VILVAAALLLVAVGLLAGGLAQGSAALQWGSFAASALAALTLGAGELRRRRADPADDPADDQADPVPAEVSPALAGAGRPLVTGQHTGLGGLAAPAEPAGPAAVHERPAAPPTTALPPDHDDHPWAAAEPAEVPQPATGVHAGHAMEPASAGTTGPTTGAHAAAPDGPATGAHAAVPAAPVDGEPLVEVVEVTDLLLVLDLTDEVLVVDEHPRYHLAGCPHLGGVDTIGLPMVEARTDGFTPCGTCAPDHNLALRERTRRAG
jgi:hypothetical protein